LFGAMSVRWLPRIVASFAVGAFALTPGCSGDDYPRPPCRTNQGTVHLIFTIGGCPSLTSFEILPATVDVGSSVQLLASAAITLDETPRFSWAATGGKVADPSAANTTFECTDPGVVDLTVTLSATSAVNCPPVIGSGSVRCELARDAATSGTD
jgi:hypothetical protein